MDDLGVPLWIENPWQQNMGKKNGLQCGTQNNRPLVSKGIRWTVIRPRYPFLVCQYFCNSDAMSLPCGAGWNTTHCFVWTPYVPWHSVCSPETGEIHHGIVGKHPVFGGESTSLGESQRLVIPRPSRQNHLPACGIPFVPRWWTRDGVGPVDWSASQKAMPQPQRSEKPIGEIDAKFFFCGAFAVPNVFCEVHIWSLNHWRNTVSPMV